MYLSLHLSLYILLSPSLSSFLSLSCSRSRSLARTHSHTHRSRAYMLQGMHHALAKVCMNAYFGGAVHTTRTNALTRTHSAYRDTRHTCFKASIPLDKGRRLGCERQRCTSAMPYCHNQHQKQSRDGCAYCRRRCERFQRSFFQDILQPSHTLL